MSWLANGYTVVDYDGSSKTTYLDPANIDYPPVPEPDHANVCANGHATNGNATGGLAHVGILQSTT